MKYTITGDNLQFVNISMDPNEEFKASAGYMRYMTGNIEMDTKMEGGLLGGLKRSVMGESLFMVKFRT